MAVRTGGPGLLAAAVRACVVAKAPRRTTAAVAAAVAAVALRPPSAAAPEPAAACAGDAGPVLGTDGSVRAARAAARKRRRAARRARRARLPDDVAMAGVGEPPPASEPPPSSSAASAGPTVCCAPAARTSAAQVARAPISSTCSASPAAGAGAVVDPAQGMDEESASLGDHGFVIGDRVVGCSGDFEGGMGVVAAVGADVVVVNVDSTNFLYTGSPVTVPSVSLKKQPQLGSRQRGRGERRRRRG